MRGSHRAEISKRRVRQRDRGARRSIEFGNHSGQSSRRLVRFSEARSNPVASVVRFADRVGVGSIFGATDLLHGYVTVS